MDALSESVEEWLFPETTPGVSAGNCLLRTALIQDLSLLPMDLPTIREDVVVCEPGAILFSEMPPALGVLEVAARIFLIELWVVLVLQDVVDLGLDARFVCG
jgi:hypothetical protein